jgi:hypothetical protein
MNSIWLSALHKDEAAVQKTMSQMKTYGLNVLGHFWQNENAKLAWLAALEEMMKAKSTLWTILGRREDLLNEELRYGLSMMALGLQAKIGPGFPIVILQQDALLLESDALPSPLQRAALLDAANAGTPAKLVAKVHAATPDLPTAYKIDMVGNPHFGQWFEIYPTKGIWPGIIFGVDQGDIRFQAVGPPGKLPEKTTLEFAMQGLKIQIGDKEYNAWALRNEISPETAYFVKIEGMPASIIFGAFTEDEETDLFVLNFK